MKIESNISKELSRTFDERRSKIYATLQLDNINYFMYITGITLGSYHLKHSIHDPVFPYSSIFKPLWDSEIWTRVTYGIDDREREQEIIDQEFHEVTIPYFDHLISKAVEYDRPTWAIFGLVGMMQGALNENAFDVSQSYKWKCDDFIRCLKYLKSELLIEIRASLEYLFAYFDERNYTLSISENEGITINILQNSPTALMERPLCQWY
jgi:hypothetical protein